MLNPFNLPNGESELFRDLEQFRHEVNRIFNRAHERQEAGRPTRGGSFPVNVYGSDDELVLTAELPGVAPEAVNLTIEENLLTITFERPEPGDVKPSGYHRRERAYGKFSRMIELPVRVDADKVEARADNGVLQVRLPRLEADKPRKIAIKATR